MPRLAKVSLLALALALAAPAQTNFAAAGVSYQPGASPAVAGTGLYARHLTDDTWAFTVIDALPAEVKPFTVTTNVGAGIAQKVATLGVVKVYIPAAAGFSWTGSNSGWSWNAGGLALVPLKGSWYLAPSLRFLKSSVSTGSGYQLIAGVGVGWGW